MTLPREMREGSLAEALGALRGFEAGAVDGGERLAAIDLRLMALARLVGSWSGCAVAAGCVVADAGGAVLATGHSSPPRGAGMALDEDESRARYMWAEHAERDALYAGARRGVALGGCTLYATHQPCADCARGIVRAGILRVVLPAGGASQDEAGLIGPDWKESTRAAREILAEGGVATRELRDPLPRGGLAPAIDPAAGWRAIAVPDGRRGLWRRVARDGRGEVVALELAAGRRGDDRAAILRAGDVLTPRTLSDLCESLDMLRWAHEVAAADYRGPPGGPSAADREAARDLGAGRIVDALEAAEAAITSIRAETAQAEEELARSVGDRPALARMLAAAAPIRRGTEGYDRAEGAARLVVDELEAWASAQPATGASPGDAERGGGA